jgi:small redox-active disulfide protein 2
MEIKVLGPGCANCKRLYAEVEKALAQTGQQATITKVEKMDDIIAHGILRTPGLVIDGKVVSYGRVPDAAEIATMITTALARHPADEPSWECG